MENIFTPAFIAVVLTAVAVALPVTQMLKRLLKVEGITAVILSGLVSAVVGAVMGVTQGYSGMQLIIFVVAVFAEINGFYKLTKHKIKPPKPPTD